jgi:tetratricopeptide (TPR) repeat protein
MAKVDSLPNAAKEVLQTGSVIEREFSHEIIKRLLAFPEEELRSHLSILKESELLYERGIFPRSVYVFRHALTREVAYNSLLSKARKKIHEKIAKAIEDLYSESLGEYYELLAHHSLQGEDWQRAYRYNREAGLKTFSLSAYEEAQQYFEAALEALQNLPRAKDWIEKEIDLCFNVRAALFPQARHDEWIERMHDAKVLAERIDDDARLSNVFNYLSNFHWISGECSKAIEIGQKGLDLARRAGDFSCQVATIFHLGFYFHTIGDFSKQIELHKEIRKMVTGEAVFQRHGMANVPSATTRSCLALGMAELGDIKMIERIGQEAVEIAEHVRNAFTLVCVYDFLGMAYLRFGKVKPALQLLEKSYQICLNSGVRSHYSYTVGSLGYAYLLLNEPMRALKILEEGAREENLDASAFWISHPLIVLADAYRANGKKELAIETAIRALDLASSREERALESWAILVMGQVEADMGGLEQAMDWYQRGLNQATKFSMLPLTAHYHMGLGQLYLKRGHCEKASFELETAIKLYRSVDMSYWLPQAESSLAKINS